jgi:hypothetical protein
MGAATASTPGPVLAGFRDAAGRSGLDVTRIEGAAVDEELVRAVPRAVDLLGEKLLLWFALNAPPVS